MTTTIEIASNASSVLDKSYYAREAKGTTKNALSQPLVVGLKQRPSMKKRQPQNARRLKHRPPMKKETTPKHKWLKIKTSNEKKATLKRKRLKTKTFSEKWDHPKMQGA
jgi:hypothetical protein